MNMRADDRCSRRITRQLKVERPGGGGDVARSIACQIELHLHGAVSGGFGAADGRNLVGGLQDGREDDRRRRRRGRVVVIARGEKDTGSNGAKR
jgi:hypothetical protein